MVEKQKSPEDRFTAAPKPVDTTRQVTETKQSLRERVGSRTEEMQKHQGRFRFSAKQAALVTFAGIAASSIAQFALSVATNPLAQVIITNATRLVINATINGAHVSVSNSLERTAISFGVGIAVAAVTAGVTYLISRRGKPSDKTE